MFLCHLKLVDRNLARHTFTVMHEAYSTFEISPIQTFLPTESGFLSPFTLERKHGEWSIYYEPASSKMPEHLLEQFIMKLEKKLQEVMFSQVISGKQSN